MYRKVKAKIISYYLNLAGVPLQKKLNSIILVLQIPES